MRRRLVVALSVLLVAGFCVTGVDLWRGSDFTFKPVSVDRSLPEKLLESETHASGVTAVPPTDPRAERSDSDSTSEETDEPKAPSPVTEATPGGESQEDCVGGVVVSFAPCLSARQAKELRDARERLAEERNESIWAGR